MAPRRRKSVGQMQATRDGRAVTTVWAYLALRGADRRHFVWHARGRGGCGGGLNRMAEEIRAALPRYVQKIQELRCTIVAILHMLHPTAPPPRTEWHINKVFAATNHWSRSPVARHPVAHAGHCSGAGQERSSAGQWLRPAPEVSESRHAPASSKAADRRLQHQCCQPEER